MNEVKRTIPDEANFLSPASTESKLSGFARRHFSPIVVVLFGLLLVSPLAAEPRKVRVGIFPAAPLVFKHDSKPAGLFIDLVGYFARAKDWRIEYVEKPWNDLLIDLERGDLDLLPAVGFTSARASKYDFNRHTIYVDSGVLFTNPKLTLNTIFDLDGKRVAAVEGSLFTVAFIDYVSSFGIRCEIIRTTDNRDVMKAIQQGEADAGVCIYSLGNELAKEYPVRITAISFSPIALKFAVTKGKNADVVSAMDELMGPMIDDPDSFYTRSFRKWTLPAEKERIPSWIWYVTSGLLLLGLAFGFLSLFLKRQVALRTSHLEREIDLRREAEEKLKHSLLEKDTLIRELYHRTKNTIQVIRSMMTLQANEFSEDKEVQILIESIGNRMASIALVHEMLYKSQNLSLVSIKDYLHELTALILSSYGISKEKVALEMEIEDQHFTLDTAIPFGLLINELLTNSLKYAFRDDRKGIIRILLKKSGSDKILLVYSDNGAGVPEGFDFRNQNTLGLKLVYGIGEQQLMGKVRFDNEDGLKCSVEMAAKLYDVRV